MYYCNFTVDDNKSTSKTATKLHLINKHQTPIKRQPQINAGAKMSVYVVEKMLFPNTSKFFARIQTDYMYR